MAGKNLRKNPPGSGKSEVGRFSTRWLLKIQWDIGHIALPNASTRCQQSLEPCLVLLLWGGGEWEGNESQVCQNALISWCSFTWEWALFHRNSTDKGILQLEHYWRFMIKTSYRLILYIVWHVSTDCNGHFLTFRLLLVNAQREFGFVYQTR